MQFWCVNLCHKHVSVVIYEDHLALSCDINLVKLHLNDVCCMVNRLTGFARLNIEDLDLFLVNGVNDRNHI